MAFRAASLARSLTAQFSRTHRHLPLRAFSRSSIIHDNLVSDAVQTGEASPPKKRTRAKKIKVEEVKPIDDAAAGVVQTGDPLQVTPPQEESLTTVTAAPIDDLVAQAVQIDNQLAEKPIAPGRGRKKVEPEEIEEGTVELPPLSEWSRYFPSSFAVKTRASIMNQEHAKKVAEAFVPAGSKGKVIVEAFPGVFFYIKFVVFPFTILNGLTRTWCSHSCIAQSTKVTDKKDHCPRGRGEVSQLS